MPPPNPNYSVCLNSILPRMNNSEMICITEIDNTTVHHETNFDSENFEDYIIFNLAQNNSAYDISINENTVPVDLSFQDTSVTIKRPEPNHLKHHVVINNTDDFVTSEKFAMNLTYNSATGGLPSYKDRYVIVGRNGNKIQSNITLKKDTVSYYDSNLKLDLTLNDDPQYTTDEKWQVVFDRQYNNMNYFAAINSNLNTETGSYPFSIIEDTINNPYSLFQDGFYFTGGEQSDAGLTQSYLKQRQVNTFESAGLTTLAEVSLAATLNEYYQYEGDEFKTYKIVQDVDPSNSITLLLKDENDNFYYNTGNDFPIGAFNDINGNYGSADLYDNLMDLSSVFATVNIFDPSNSLRIADGFTATLNIGGNQSGGYIDPSAGSNPLFTIDQSSLTTDGSPENVNYFNNHKPLGIHRVDIINGSVEVEDDDNECNEQFITLSSGAETLDSSFNKQNGSVYLKSGAIVTDMTTLNLVQRNGLSHYDSSGRVSFNYTLDASNNPSGSFNTNFTNAVSVYYNHLESLGQNSYLSEEVCKNNFVQYELKLLIESTDSNSDGNTYNNLDKRNIVQNSRNSYGDLPDSQLVMATETQPVGFNLEGTTLLFGNTDTNARIRANGKVNIFNIKNEDKLVESGSLFYYEENGEKENVDGSLCSVTFTDYRISRLPYAEYRVALETKTSTDISNSVRATNKWGFTTVDPTNEYLIGNPMRVSELFQDDSKFISGSTNVGELPVKYTFYIQNADSTGVATYRSLNSVKYCFDVSLVDPTTNSDYNPISQYKFGGNTDIIFIPQTEITDVKVADIADSLITAHNLDNTKYIYQKWLRRKQYNALINPSLPFYENLLLKTNTVFEEQLFYRIWNKLPSGNKGTELYNKSAFSLNGDSMSNVYAKLVSEFGYLHCTDTSSPILTNMNTTITLHPEDCCIFKTNLQGIDISGGEWTDLGFDVSNQVWEFPQSSLDPFIVSEATVNVLGLATCHVSVNVPQETIIDEEKYYIAIDNKLGMNNAYKAELYSFSPEDLRESGLSHNFSPYLAKFHHLHRYKSQTRYDCNLIESGDDYILTITHTSNGIIYNDLTITYDRDYVLNFNVINCPYNLISVRRSIGESYDDIEDINESYVFKTNQTDLFTAEIDNGVYFTHRPDVTFGYRESFILNPDQVNIQFVDNIDSEIYYPNNDPYWGAVNEDDSPIYRDIVFEEEDSLTIVNPHEINGTKDVTLYRVRGYQFTVDTTSRPLYSHALLEREPLQVFFTLDVSFAYITHYIDPSYTNPYHQLVPGTGITVIDFSSAFVQPDASLNAIDPSYNYTYEKALYRQSYNAGVGKFNIDRLISTNDFEPDAVINGKRYALNNQLTLIDDDYYSVLNIGLKLNLTKSILADGDSAVSTYVLTTSAADYTYAFQNPHNNNNCRPDSQPHRDLINAEGNGTLFDGILWDFFNLRSRSIYVEKPLSVILRYSSSCLRVYSKNIYNERPDSLSWSDADELPTSPFYPEDLEEEGISLHPTERNGNYNISINRTACYTQDFTTYMVCAPPAYNIRFNSIQSNTNTLPIYNSDSRPVSIFVDAKTNHPEYDLWELKPGEVGNTIIITPTDSNNLNLFSLKYNFIDYPYDTPHAFEIKGNNVKLDLYSGLQQPQQVRSVSYYSEQQGLVTAYYDASLNLDPSGNNSTVGDVSYSYYVFTDSSNTLINYNYPNEYKPIYSGPIDSLTTNGVPGIIQAKKSAVGAYDVSLSQCIEFCDANNYGLNIQFKIDNAFLPPVTSYLPLPTTVSTSVAFYEAITRYNNGQYNVYLNKYWNGTSEDDDDDDDAIPLTHGYNYNYLLSENSNVRELGFRINRKSQKVICLSVDLSGIPNGQLVFNTSNECSHDIQQFLDKITPSDLSGIDWITSELPEPVNVGISFSAYDQQGFRGLGDVFKYDTSKRLLNKTLYIERNDIFRVSSFFGQPIFRITNSGNVVTNKVSTALLSIYEQSETTRQLPTFDSNTNIPGLFSPPGSIPASIIGENTLDFSGNYLVPLQQFPSA